MLTVRSLLIFSWWMQVLQNIPQTFYDSAEYSVEYIVHAECMQ